jgi:hypothetical protein
MFSNPCYIKLQPPVKPTPPNEYCIDFEYDGYGNRVHHSDYVSNEWEPWGVIITVNPGEGGYAPSHMGRIMDTATPGSDIDLGSPNHYCPGGGPGVGVGGVPGAPGENCEYEGNILIIQEANGDYVDDNAYGGSIKFSFKYEATLKKIGLMDIDEGEYASIDIKKANGSYLPSLPIHGLGDNSVQEVYLSYERNVASLQLNLGMSGGVRYLCYTLDYYSPISHRFLRRNGEK